MHQGDKMFRTAECIPSQREFQKDRFLLSTKDIQHIEHGILNVHLKNTDRGSLPGKCWPRVLGVNILSCVKDHYAYSIRSYLPSVLFRYVGKERRKMS